MNKSQIKISVAMAVYNGMYFLPQQLESILLQLNPQDELVISCDPSTDDTLFFLEKKAIADSRIHVLAGKGEGIIENFQNAIKECRGDYIFLSDQDDIWFPNKREEVIKAFQSKNCAVVVHDAKIIDECGKLIASSFFEMRKCGPGYIKNLIKNTYIGCCMAFKKELMPVILPFPVGLPMHDQWIGLLSHNYGGSYFLRKPLIQYRRHQNNASNTRHSGYGQMLDWRINLVKNIWKREKQCKKK